MTALAEAEAALTAWGGAKSLPVLIKDRENAVFYVTLSSGRRVALRLHRAGYQSLDAIRSELWWTEQLASAGLPVPRPVPTLDGTLLQTGPHRAASVIDWVPGSPLGEAFQPLPGSRTKQVQHLRTIGHILARLHDATDRLTLPDNFTRPRWDIDGLLGEAPFWGRFWENPALTEDERAVLHGARAMARDILLATPLDTGLIHADLMRENLLVDGDAITMIDFDDSGFGFRLYDLGTLMLQNLDEPAFPALQEAAIEGYRSVRPLSDTDAALIPMFTMLRCLASCGWAVPRMAPGDPRLRTYAERAARQGRAFLAGR